MMFDPIDLAIVAIIIVVYFVTAIICLKQTINEQEHQIDDLLIVAKMRDTYVAELQHRLERIELHRRLEHQRQAAIIDLAEFGHITFDARHDICYVVPVYKN